MSFAGSLDNFISSIIIEQRKKMQESEVLMFPHHLILLEDYSGEHFIADRIIRKQDTLFVEGFYEKDANLSATIERKHVLLYSFTARSVADVIDVIYDDDNEPEPLD